MCRLQILVVLCVISAPVHCCSADFETEFRAASDGIDRVRERAERLLVEGRLDEANQLFLATFPEPSRTAVQAYLLGNVLYETAPRISYGLHQRAAREIRDQPNVDLEWALQQHRAREFVGAAETYAKYLAANPDYAPVHGLLAECLIRQGKTEQALNAWQDSERAGRGTLERFESLVCDVNRDTFPDRERADLIFSVRKGDVSAAEKLIGIDCQFEIDWWNRITHVNYLKHDLALIRNIEFDESDRKHAAVCAGECAVAVESEKGDVAKILRSAGYLLDTKKSLPRNGTVLECMLRAALSAQAITIEEARTNWSEVVLSHAQEQKDPVLFNLAAFLTVGDPRCEKSQQLGWEFTGDRRCAVGRILSLDGSGKLSIDHPLFIKAVQQFPDDAILAGFVVRLKAKSGQPLETELIRAIQAEYSHFSDDALLLRPHANKLRGYFRALQELRAKQKPQG